MLKYTCTMDSKIDHTISQYYGIRPMGIYKSHGQHIIMNRKC